jgi:phospholipase C
MSRSLRRVLAIAVSSLTVMSFTAVQAGAEGREGGNNNNDNGPLGSIKHLVVIYEENHSFDNLYGGWEGVNGLANATTANKQIAQDTSTYSCLLQNDVNLPAGCNFANQPFNIDQYIPTSALTCPAPGTSFSFPHGVPVNTPGALAGGCTEDIVHRYYQEQYQLNHGQQNRYVTGSDAVGLVMGYYKTQNLPIYKYLHGQDAPSYAISDNFFQSAFGGSFLNHQWLIAAASPTWAGGPDSRHAVIDSNGMPTKYPLYTPAGPVNDSGTPLIQQCGLPTTNPNWACGDFAVNTIQPGQQPFKGSPQLPLQTGKTIGDELSKANVSWAWYSGGWSNADGDAGAPGWTNGTNFGVCSDPYSSLNGTTAAKWYCPNKVFQYHHQPFNYFQNYAPGTAGRTHLQDEQAFMNLANASEDQCKLNSVSFIKPIGLENEHPGYTSETAGSSHLVQLLSAINNSACPKDTMVVVTYDEFGGQWDHVAPPGQGNTNGPHDQWGPGTRIPTLVLAPHLRDDFVVDHTQYDTTSILATIEHRWGLAALGSRDGAVKDLSSVFRAKSPSDD